MGNPTFPAFATPDGSSSKEFLYRLQHMELDAPNWLETIREFRAAVEAHAKMEEEQVFPRLRSEIDDELDERITKEVNRAGFMMA